MSENSPLTRQTSTPTQKAVMKYSHTVNSSDQSSSLPRLGFLASYNGSSMQAIVQEILSGAIPAIPHIIVSNNPDAYALHFAQEHAIKSAHISRKTLGNDAAVDEALVTIFADCDWIILSGYMRPIGPKMLQHFRQKIFNIHPSLLPAFSGEGMYGRKIHAAVIQARVSHTGITIHQVEAGYDTGEIVAQMSISVSPEDTIESLEDKVKSHEPAFFADYIRKLCEKNYPMDPIE